VDQPGGPDAMVAMADALLINTSLKSLECVRANTRTRTRTHTHTHTHRHPDTQTHRQTDTHTPRHTDTQTHRHTDTHIHTQSCMHTIAFDYLLRLLSLST
jgi:hypothetical protein